jgi:hypothetical protein
LSTTPTLSPDEEKLTTIKKGTLRLLYETNKQLAIKLEELQKLKETEAQSNDEMRQLADIIRIIQRAMKGLDPEDDVFMGLINPKDIRERTRLEETGLLSHSAMRVAASYFPEFSMFEKIADMEDPYYISQDGEGRKEAILTVQAKTKMDGNMILNMPNTNGGVAETDQPQAVQPKKKSFISKVLHR